MKQKSKRMVYLLKCFFGIHRNSFFVIENIFDKTEVSYSDRNEMLEFVAMIPISPVEEQNKKVRHLQKIMNFYIIISPELILLSLQ